MDTLFLILIIAVPILSVLGWLFWMLVFGYAAKKSFEAASRSGMLGGFPGGGAGDLNAIFAQLEQTLRTASGGAGGYGAGTGQSNLSPAQQLQIQTMLMQAHNQMAQMDALSRQRYDTKMGDLSGMAASAGLDWSPPPY